MDEIKEIAVLAGITSDRRDVTYSDDSTIDELAELAKTAGAEVAAKVLQPKDAPDVATYLGKGKIEELTELCKNLDANLIIFDDELSASQRNNIEDITGVRVTDRTTLILDIFASRAISSEGKLQVELAQLKYILPRLMGIGKSLSRLGAGIGTRGPGETKLETDRRHIRSHISKIQSQLKEVEKRRGYMRERRKKDGFQTVALVGYTNAGKSTILNCLTDAGVLAEDKLFATLDPTARALTLPDGREVILIDTVGFIRKLPHHLVNAFKSTLEETQYASLILNVVDYSNEEYLEHLKVSENLLTELGCSDIPVLNVFNKCDRVDADTGTFGNNVYVSAKNGTNMDELLRMICTHLPVTKRRMSLLIPYAQAGLSAQLREDGVIINEEYAENGVKITADVEQKAVYKYEQYEI